jgi:hypothetical protein
LSCYKKVKNPINNVQGDKKINEREEASVFYINKNKNLVLSARTLSSHVCSRKNAFHGRVATKKLYIRKKNYLLTLKFANGYICKDNVFWNKIIFRMKVKALAIKKCGQKNTALSNAIFHLWDEVKRRLRSVMITSKN